MIDPNADVLRELIREMDESGAAVARLCFKDHEDNSKLLIVAVKGHEEIYEVQEALDTLEGLWAEDSVTEEIGEEEDG